MAENTEGAASGTGFTEVPVFGLPIHRVTQAELIRYVVSESAAHRGGYVITVNTDHLQQISRNPELRQVAMRATIRTADGMPVLWASRLRGTPLSSRVAGSDLIEALSGALATAGQSLFLLGGEEGAADGAAAVLTSRYPGMKVVGTHGPPHGFEKQPSEMALIERLLATARPDHVLLGLPFVKASLLAEQLRPLMQQGWFYGLGISFSFLTSEVERAPAWMQRFGLEWLHRFAQEPRRLFRRYFIDGIPFAVRLLVASALERRQSQREPGR